MDRINYRRYYFLIVISIIALTVISQIIIRFHLENQTNDGTKISIAGYQTAVAQEISSLAHEQVLQKSTDKSSKSTDNQLKKSIIKFEERHQALQYGNALYNLEGENSEKVSGLLSEAYKDLAKIKSNSDSLIAVSLESPNINSLAILSNNVEAYTQKLNEVVYEYKKENSSKISQLKIIELALSGIMILVLLLEIFMVIKPVLNKLNLSNKSLRESNEELKKLNKTKSEFLANMSHEIRTPLNGVIGMAHVLTHSKLDSEQKESVETIKTSALNLLDILNEILDFSKLESGKVEVEEVKFSLIELTEEIFQLLAPTAKSKGIRMLTDIEADIPQEIISDYSKIRQVLINLIGNAIKFTENGEIVLKISQTNAESGFTELLFCVQDSGIGISEDKLDTIFESFTQADNSTTRKYGGTGLGLSICKDLVELLNGNIWVESKLNDGSSFYFTAVAQQGNTLSYLTENIKSFKGKKALIVDDNLTNLKILVKLLSHWEIGATPFNNPDLVLSISDELENFDFCILDMQMPNTDGLELARTIRKNYTQKELPIILLSSAPEDKSITPLPYEYFLQKPLKQTKLISSLKELYPEAKKKKESSINQVSKPSPKELNHGGIKVLIVEDNAINRAVAIKSLELLGLPATTAVDGEEALKLIQSELFDLILMDIQMPQMDGFETTNEIRRILSQNDQPVIIAMTATSKETDKSIYLKKGMDDFIPKPLDLDELNGKIHHWFE